VRLSRLLALLLLAVACRAKEDAARPAAGARPTPTPVPPPALGFLDESREGTPVEGGVLRRRL